MELSQEMWCAFGYVKCSGYRTMVLKSLGGGEKTPYMIAEDCGLLPSNIYKTLRQLRDYGLISCKNPNITKWRVYMLTDKGKELVEILNS